MFDTMTLTKTVGALCGALLILLLGSWASETIYHAGGEGDGWQQAYAIDTGAEETKAAEADVAEEVAAPEAATEPEAPATAEAGGFAALVAAADPEDGEKVFKKCKSCHVADKKQNRVGPHLVGIVGRDVASAEGFSYSEALTGIGEQWTLDRLNAWLEKPRDFAPGNKMTFPGLSKQEDRTAVIAWLQSLAQ